VAAAIAVSKRDHARALSSKITIKKKMLAIATLGTMSLMEKLTA
jgi:hypothetical protein